MNDAEKVRLTSWIIKQHRLGVEWPEITSNVLDDLKHRSRPTISERIDDLLRYLASKSETIGTVVKFSAQDNARTQITAFELLAWTGSRLMSEVITLAEFAAEEKCIDHRRTSFASGNDLHELMLKPEGYVRIANLDRANTGSKQAFVAMWFANSMTETYEKAIAPAIRDAGYEPLRIDAKDHNNKIDDEIVAEIRRSRFLVADFTADFDLTGVDTKRPDKKGARGGVYYEAGFAHGLNIPVIFSCRSNVVDYLHFDIRQYNCLVWTDNGSGSEDKPPFSLSGLRKALSNRISATIGDGPLKKSA